MPSKLTFHISGYDSNVLNLLEQMQPSLVKVFDFPSETNIDEIRRRCPNALIVYRQFTDLDFRNPADAYFAELTDTLRKLKGRGIVWEGINEPVINNTQDAAALSTWTIRFAELMHALGEKTAAFSFSTANPRLDLVPLLGDAAAASDYIALHEYYSPSRGAVDLGRYRAFRARLPRAARKPIVITECGLDDGASQGWQAYFSQSQYLANLADYDNILLQDSYIVGGMIFQYGAGAPWASFDVAPMGARIAQYVAGQGGGAGRATDEPLQFPGFIYGVHDIGGEGELTSAHRSGWFVDTIDLRTQTAGDYAAFAKSGVEPIVRLNNGYGTAGTIPPSDQYDAFAAKCAAFVLNSPDARIWVIGNEMNYHDERPELPGGAREAITPDKYAACFLKCRAAIKKVPGHANDWVLPGAVAPYVAETTYPGNERGDWVKYLVDILTLLGKNVDGIALHCYTHDYQINQVTWDAMMQPPFNDRHYDFRAYRDFLTALPTQFRQLPVLITETNPVAGWGNSNIGWVQAAYQEINSWNSVASNQPIQALNLYRWKNLPDHPEWSVSNKAGVVDDYRAAITLGYRTSWSPQATTIITQVDFTPVTMVAGQTLQVSITVTNNGTTPLVTQGPDPGLIYEEGDTFYTRNFPEIPGSFRVGVDFDNRSGVDHPYRWGLGSPLAPGETRTIVGAIHLKNIQARNYWAGLVQERIVWIQDKQGTRLITVTPSVRITNVSFAPMPLVSGQLLNVSITLQNDGNAPLLTQGPDPGLVYDEADTFLSRGFADVTGNYRVGVDFDGRTGIDHPYRWGLGLALAPGESRTITGSIRVKTTGTRNFWAGLVQEHIAWTQDRSGVTAIAVTAPGAGPQITAVTMAPTTLSQGGYLSVAIAVRNDGNAPLATQGPDPGFIYEEGDTFASRGFDAVQGNYRVGIDFDGRSGLDHPYRWGLGSPLAPGETRVITGAIHLKQAQSAPRNYWAGLVQEYVAWLQDRRGQQLIMVNPGVKIIAVSIAPTTLVMGQLLNMSVTVRNDGNGLLPTQGPDPGFIYDEGDTFASRGYDAVQGNYRIAIDFGNRTGLDHPYRWGFGTPLNPGETRTITSAIRVNTAQTQDYWVGLVQERVAWLQDREGATNVVVTNAPPQFSFTATPTTLLPGESATLNWDVRNASTVRLDGRLVAAIGSRVVTPTQTTTYTLHIVFADASTRDAMVTIMVAGLPPGSTRYPSVTLSPDNIARLRTYPRPAQDNGRGLHFNIDLRDTTIANTVSHLQSINAKWTLIYAPDELQAGRAASACWDAGIMPVVRIGKKVDEFFDPIQYVRALTNIGAPPYVQIYNEPGDDREWRNWPGDANWIGIFAQRWADKAIAVYDAGGYPGLQVLGREEFIAAVNAVRTSGRMDIFQRAFFALHNYGANHPPSYPYDALNNTTIFDDDTAVLVFIEYAAWMQEQIGYVLPIIGGEGGWQWAAQEDMRYPQVNQPYHANYHAEMFDWFRTNVLSNGEPMQDYLFSITPWIEGGWGADDWWGGPAGDKTQTIAAVQALPPFTRKFSWDPGMPPLPPPTFSFTASPNAISAGQSAVLQWNIIGARFVYLDGQRVASDGTRVVTPTQTTTYLLHLLLADGTTNDLNATVFVR